MTARAADSSVIICAYADERWGDLCNAIASACAQTAPPREIVVVIDHNPALLERVRAEFPDVVAIANTETRGLSGARNSGVRACSGTIIAFLDDDAVASPQWLAELTRGFDDPRVFAVGGAIDPAWDQGHPRWFPPEFNWVVGCGYRGLPEATAPIRNVIGANMAFRRAVFAEAGSFLTGFGRVGAIPAGCEETELCIRARQRWPTGIVLYEPAAVVRHRVPAPRATWGYFSARCFAEGRSKALVAAAVGGRDGLASERAYTLRALPLGVARGLEDAARRRDPTGLARAGAIIAGLTMTTMGYAAGRASNRRPPAHKLAMSDTAAGIVIERPRPPRFSEE